MNKKSPVDWHARGLLISELGVCILLATLAIDPLLSPPKPYSIFLPFLRLVALVVLVTVGHLCNRRLGLVTTEDRQTVGPGSPCG